MQSVVKREDKAKSMLRDDKQPPADLLGRKLSVNITIKQRGSVDCAKLRQGMSLSNDASRLTT